MAVIEDLFDVTVNDRELGEPAEDSEREAVAHDVSHPGSAIGGFEAVGVMPEAIGAFALEIHESMRRFPDSDFCCPGQGEASHAEAVVQLGVFLDGDAARADDVKTQPRGR